MKYKKMNKIGGIRDYVISAVLVGLFVVSILSFANFGAIDNNGRNIMNDAVINSSFGQMENTLGDFQTAGATQLNATTTESPTNSFGSLVLFSIVGAGRVFTGSVTGVYNIINVLLIQKLGIPPIIINVIGTCILVSLIFFAYRMYRLGT